MIQRSGVHLYMLKPLHGLLSASLILSGPGFAQQAADPGYRPKVAEPAFADGGPVVAIDQAHRNFHVLDGRYAPFGALLRADGYRPKALVLPATAESLAGTGILVIANAETGDGQAAFAPAEIAAIKAWVEQGGSLLLIADHAPFGVAAASLAAAFGVEMGGGYVAARQDGEVTSRIGFSARMLGAHAILAGRKSAERVQRVESFTGQSLSIPPGATALLLLPEDALEVAGPPQLDALRRGERAPGRGVGGRAQAVALEHGKGRVVIAGEAAMFTAQRTRTGAEVGLAMADNERFTLNTMRWLARAIP